MQFDSMKVMRRLVKGLGVCLILIAVFSVSLYFFNKRAQQNSTKQKLILTPAVINRPLPAANLVNISGKPLDDENLRRGKVLLVFAMTDCKPCDQENDFLKTVIATRQDLTFFYVIPFGNKDKSLKEAQSKYAFETFFDVGSTLARTLEIYEVPIKVFLEDGVIKKTWSEASVNDKRQTEFKDWLSSL
jgi:hypothetical protein